MKRNIKKILVLLIFIFTISLPIYAIDALDSVSEELVIEGTRSFEMLSSEMNNYVNSQIIIEKFTVSGENIDIIGYIDEEKFNLFGKIYQSRLNNKKLVFDFQSSKSGLEVIHSSFIHSVTSKDELLIENEGKDIFILYLMNDGEYYSYEVKLSEYFDINFNSYYEDYEDSKIYLDHWWIEVYEPIIEDIDIEEDNVILSNIDKYSKILTRNTPYRKFKTRRVSYRENNYTYEMDLIYEMEVSDIGQNRRDVADVRAKIYIDDHRVYQNGRFIDDAPVLGLAYGDISFKLNDRNDDYFIGVGWNTDSSYPSPRITVNFGVGFRFFSLDWERTVPRVSGYESIPVAARNKYKSATVYNDIPLKKERDSYQVYGDIYATNIDDISRFIDAEFRCGIYLVNHRTIVDKEIESLYGTYR